MRRVLFLVAAAACGGSEAPPPTAGPSSAVATEPAEPPETAIADAAPADDPAAIETHALEACQRAKTLFEQGDAPGAVALVDEAYGLLLSLPDDDEHLQVRQDIRLVAADVIARIYGRAAPELPSNDAGLVLIDNDAVQYEIQRFTGAERQDFLAAYKRAGRWRPMILDKLAAAGLPSQLSWLPLVESQFEPSALSGAGALGLWQFISSTGLRYGLERDEWIDHRLDAERSTDAAVAYLGELHRLFGDWQKALAAYNCGENQVARLQKRSEGQYLDFWDLYVLLPKETRRYVPRLIATIRIIEEPAKYGMKLPEPDAPFDAEMVQITRPVKLAALEQTLGIPQGTLWPMNPALRQDSTPTTAYDLRVPRGYGVQVTSTIGALPEYIPPPKPKYITHRVKSGETLSHIAERYGTSVTTLMKVNALRSANRLSIGQRIRVPMRG